MPHRSAEEIKSQLKAWHNMFGLREKLSLCFAGLLVVVLAMGYQGVYQLNRLSTSIDAILEEDFLGVLASDDMQEGIERIDSGILFWLLGHHQDGLKRIERGRHAFRVGLASCNARAATPVERARLDDIQEVYANYDALIGKLLLSPPDTEEVTITYTERLQPPMQRMHALASSIGELNRARIVARQGDAEAGAEAARWQTMGVLSIALVLAFAAIYFSGRWLLMPILQLTQAAEEIRSGNLDVYVLPTSDDELGILVRTFNDMSRRLSKLDRTQKARLLKSNVAMSKILDNLSDGIALVDWEGRVEFASYTAEEVFKIRPNTLLSESAEVWITNLVVRAMDSEDPVFGEDPYDVVQRFVDGEERFYFPSAVEILDDNDEAVGVLLFIRDITDLRLQQELKQDAIATVSHQLKTPLTSIQMALHMLGGGKFGDLNEMQNDLLETARQESDRLLRMVMNLLDSSRLKSGRNALECSSESLGQLLEAYAAPVREVAAQKQVSIAIEMPDELPEVWVDAGRVEHVFNNLMGNAVDYSPPASVVQVSVVTESEWLRVTVEDSGPGIGPDACERIFEQFYRGPGSEMVEGAGLGLYIVKQIVEAHGGRITVEGRPGQGARFTVWFPRADACVNLGLVDGETSEEAHETEDER